MMKQVKLKRAARERDGIAHCEDESMMAQQSNEQCSRSEMMEQMKLNRAARKQDCENEAIMRKSAVGSPNATMPRHRFKDESSSQPTQVVDPPVRDIPAKNHAQSIPNREAEQNIQAPSITAARKPPVNASHGPLGQAALPMQFGSFTGLAPKAPQVLQSSSRPASSGSVPGTPRSRLARIRELQAQRGLTPTFKTDESKGICVVSDEHHTMASKPIELNNKIAGITRNDSPVLVSHVRSEPAEEPEPPAVAMAPTKSATPCGDDKIKSLRIEKVVMVNEHYEGEDGLLPGTFAGSPRAKMAPKIAEAQGESYDSVLQDMKLRWTRYSVTAKDACHTNSTKTSKEGAAKQDSDGICDAAVPTQINFQLTPRHADEVTCDDCQNPEGCQASLPRAPVSPQPSTPLSPLSNLKKLRLLDQASEVEAVWREVDAPVDSSKKASPRKGGLTPKDKVVPLPPLDSASGPLSKTLGCMGGAEFLSATGKRDDCALVHQTKFRK